MTFVFSLVLGIYMLLLLALLVGWVRIRRQPMPQRNRDPVPITVVVAARNEAGNIGSLLDDLRSTAFPPDRFEVIIVDDHSTDATPAIVRNAIATFPQAKFFQLADGHTGKKAALQLGIEQSRFGVIATTDADCTVSKNWLTCLASYFGLASTKLLVGPVKIAESRSFIDSLQVMEFVSVAGATAATIGLGHPVMANGANLAFRKETFTEVGGYNDNLIIASGDDEFLLRKIFRKYPDGIRYLNYYEAAITTAPLPTIGDFVSQRIRWAGKWRHNSDWVARALAFFILLAQFSFLALIILSVWQPSLPVPIAIGTIGLLIIKLLMEGVFIAWVSRFLDRRFDVGAFVVLEILYPFYVLFIGIGSLFLSFQWKGRRYSRG
jgi:biofilm PGA synthesis N-glycosyltransferase PgaC